MSPTKAVRPRCRIFSAGAFRFCSPPPTPPTTLSPVRDGKRRALAIPSAARSPDLPDVPTMTECGLGELTLDFWAGMLAPAGTPPAVVDTLNAAINASLQSP